MLHYIYFEMFYLKYLCKKLSYFGVSGRQNVNKGVTNYAYSEVLRNTKLKRTFFFLRTITINSICINNMYMYKLYK